ncbi:MAG: chorismate synthase [Saprospiraceae bacterium]|nr:chorismate synthase [Saprospiraceae bacterium]
MNSFGRILRVSIYGESHGAVVGVILDGVPAGIKIVEEDFLQDILKRKPGGKGTTTRIENDVPVIKSGIFNSFSTGAPICIEFINNNIRSDDYNQIVQFPRPGHSDFVAKKKFNSYNDHRGGGHFSGRLTLPIVAAGVIAKKILPDLKIRSNILEVGGNNNIEEALELAIEKRDSIGGIIECTVSNLPIGLGEPFFDSVESVLSHLIFAIPAVKGIEFGAGFSSAKMFGSDHNDTFIDASGKTKTNHSGGISGGLSNGNDLILRIAVKPSSSIPSQQESYHFGSGRIEKLIIEGRHDLCIAMRVPVVLEAVVSIGICDLYFINELKNI